MLAELRERYLSQINDEYTRIPPPGFEVVNVGYIAVLSQKGEIVEMIPLADGKRKSSLRVVPHSPGHTNAACARFLSDNPKYVFGLDERDLDGVKSAEHVASFKELHRKLLAGCDDDGARAMLAFVDKDINEILSYPAVQRESENLKARFEIVFRLEGDVDDIHMRPVVREHWERIWWKRMETGDFGDGEPVCYGQCTITGQRMPLARVVPMLSGVDGAPRAKISLISFNFPAAEAYGKKQAYNSPVGVFPLYQAITALQDLLFDRDSKVKIVNKKFTDREKDSYTVNIRRRKVFGDMTTVFWADRPAPFAEAVLDGLFDDSRYAGDRMDAAQEKEVQQLIRDVIVNIRSGRYVDWDMIETDAVFYILGLVPNDNRLSIKLWQKSSFGVLEENMRQHYQDFLITGAKWDISVQNVLMETIRKSDKVKKTPTMGGALVRAMLTGGYYPSTLYSAILVRIRADAKVNFIRAAAIKAYLNRKNRLLKTGTEEFSVELDKNRKDTPYLLGRLFAVLEWVKKVANATTNKKGSKEKGGKKDNKSLAARYLSAASALPAKVFPRLIADAQYHMSKVGYGHFFDKDIQEILAEVKDFPVQHKFEEQGAFMLGYYHQKAEIARAIKERIEAKERGEIVDDELAELLEAEGMEDEE